MKPDQISKTAAFIAIKFYGLTREKHYAALFSDFIVQFYNRLVDQLPNPLSHYHTLLKYYPLRKLFNYGEELLLPGDLAHILARKLQIGIIMNEAVQQHYSQLLVLGAGFDHLAAQYSLSGLKCMELDTPKMAICKKEFLDTYNYSNPELQITEFDFNLDRFGDYLETQQFLNQEKPTIVVSEGFFDYLEPQRVEKILQTLKNYFMNDIVLLSTFFDLTKLNAFRRFVFESGVKLVGERIELNLNLNEFTGLCTSSGFRISDIINSNTMERNLGTFLSDSPNVLPGFSVVLLKN